MDAAEVILNHIQGAFSASYLDIMPRSVKEGIIVRYIIDNALEQLQGNISGYDSTVQIDVFSLTRTGLREQADRLKEKMLELVGANYISEADVHIQESDNSLTYRRVIIYEYTG